jgi:hypothetical protein
MLFNYLKYLHNNFTYVLLMDYTVHTVTKRAMVTWKKRKIQKNVLLQKLPVNLAITIAWLYENITLIGIVFNMYILDVYWLV